MDIGWPEFLVLGGLAVLIFGPDKLPKVAADAGRMVRRLRQLADSARTDLTDAAGVDVRSIANDLKSVADLHPKRLLGSAVANLTDRDDRNSGAPSGGPPTAAGRADTDGTVSDPALPTARSAASTEAMHGSATPSGLARTPGHDPDAT